MSFRPEFTWTCNSVWVIYETNIIVLSFVSSTWVFICGTTSLRTPSLFLCHELYLLNSGLARLFFSLLAQYSNKRSILELWRLVLWLPLRLAPSACYLSHTSLLKIQPLRNKKQISVGKQQQPAEQRHGDCVHIEISIYIFIGSLSHVAWIPGEIFFSQLYWVLLLWYTI